MKPAVPDPDAPIDVAHQNVDRIGFLNGRAHVPEGFDAVAAEEIAELFGIAQYDDESVTATLNAFVDQGVAEAVPNAGRALIDSGDWEW